MISGHEGAGVRLSGIVTGREYGSVASALLYGKRCPCDERTALPTHRRRVEPTDSIALPPIRKPDRSPRSDRSCICGELKPRLSVALVRLLRNPIRCLPPGSQVTKEQRRAAVWNSAEPMCRHPLPSFSTTCAQVRPRRCEPKEGGLPASKGCGWPNPHWHRQQCSLSQVRVRRRATAVPHPAHGVSRSAPDIS